MSPRSRTLAPFAVVLFACGGAPPAGPATPAVTTPPTEAAPAAITPTASAPAATAKAGATPTPPVAPPPSAPTDSPACSALAKARAAENATLKEMSDSKDPLKRVLSLDASERATFESCVTTKRGGAWGLALRDVKAEHNGINAQLFALHIDDKGQKSEVALTGHSERNKARAFILDDRDHVSLETLRTFDYDGDGEEELIVLGHDQTHEGPKDPESWVVGHKAGATTLYAPLKDVVAFRAEDNDRDGRLDFVTYGPYRSRYGARCNGAPSLAIGPAMLVHSLPDGTFSTQDATAVKFAKQSCEKGGFSVARDDEKRVDDETTFMNLACARLWGMSDAQASAAISGSCSNLSGEATCSEASLKQCVYGDVLQKWSRATPPVTLK